MTEAVALTLVCEVEGGRAVAQAGPWLYVLSACCRRLYKADPTYDHGDGTKGASVCIGCLNPEKPLPVDPEESPIAAWWALRVPLTATHVTEATLTEWVAAWLGAEVEHIELVQTA